MTTDHISQNQLSLSNLPVFKSDLIKGHELHVFGTFENPLFISKDIATILGYKYTVKAVNTHGNKKDKIRYSDLIKFGEAFHFPGNIQGNTILIN